jgi:hypothetical protein
MQSLSVRDSAAVEMPRVDGIAGRLRVNGQALRPIFRPVRAGACVGFGTDRTVSTAASGCEGSHVDDPRRHIGLVWPRRDTRPELVGRVPLRSRSGAGQRSAGPPNQQCWADMNI